MELTLFLFMCVRVCVEVNFRLCNQIRFFCLQKESQTDCCCACYVCIGSSSKHGLFKLPFPNNNNLKVSSAVKASGKNLFEIINNSLEQVLLRLRRLNGRTPPSFTFQRILSQSKKCKKKQTNFLCLVFFLANPQLSRP